MRSIVVLSVLVVSAGAVDAPAAPADPIGIEVRMAAGALGPGEPHALVVETAVAGGWSAVDAGIPGIFVQLEVPPSVTLSGKVLETEAELKKSGFLHQPFERLVTPGPARIEFTLDREPQAGETIGVNVVAYLLGAGGGDGDGGENGADVAFVRRRFELPVARDAVAVAGDPNDTAWGRGASDPRCGLRIGDRADPFALPRADGSLVELAGFRGRKNVLVTTYRAHW